MFQGIRQALYALRHRHCCHTVKAGVWDDPATWRDGRVPKAHDCAHVWHNVALIRSSSMERPIILERGGLLWGPPGTKARVAQRGGPA